MKWSDFGTSSLTLLATHAGLDIACPDAPYGPSDFSRCIHLFECLKFNKKSQLWLLEETANKYPCWKPFYEHWNELIELWNLEKSQENAPKLYALIKNIRKEV